MAIYEKFVGASRDDFLSLEDAQTNFKLTYGENFNFAYDVIDELGRTKPDKLAMVWLSNKKEEKNNSFKISDNVYLALIEGTGYFLILKFIIEKLFIK